MAGRILGGFLRICQLLDTGHIHHQSLTPRPRFHDSSSKQNHTGRYQLMSDLKTHGMASASLAYVLIESSIEAPHHHFFSKSLKLVGFRLSTKQSHFLPVSVLPPPNTASNPHTYPQSVHAAGCNRFYIYSLAHCSVSFVRDIPMYKHTVFLSTSRF